MVDLVIPHTCRLVGLTVRLNRSSSFNQIVERLRYPIPTLHTFRISAIHPFPPALGFPSGVNDAFFLHSKKLEIRGISAFHGPNLFPYVTELTLSTNGYEMVQMNHFLETLEQLPLLERVYVVFCSGMCSDITPHMTKLPLVQTMSLPRLGKSSSEAVNLPRILGYLRLPKLTSLSLQIFPHLTSLRPIFPVISFGEHLPNFVELPELKVDIGSGEATFRNSSGATLKYQTELLLDYNSVERNLWGDLPLRSVRRLTINMAHQPIFQDCMWFIELLRDLTGLEHLELGGECGGAIRWLCGEISEETTSIRIQTLIVRYGEHERLQALRLKQLADAAGLTTTLICVPDPGVRGESEVGVDTGGSG